MDEGGANIDNDITGDKQTDGKIYNPMNKEEFDFLK